MKLSVMLACAAAIGIAGAIGMAATSPAGAAKKKVHVSQHCSPDVPYWWCGYQDPKLTGYGPPPVILAPWGVIKGPVK